MVYIASNHIGIQLKATVVNLLESKNIRVEDLSPSSSERVHYTGYVKKLCKKY